MQLRMLVPVLILISLFVMSLTNASQAADNTICDGTAGAAYGLCTAYCEAMDCEGDSPQASETACGRVYSNYSTITGSAPPCSITEMIVFATSTLYDGNLGGLAGADLKCQMHAVTAGLNGTFKAWLSDSSLSASDRLTHSTVPYVRVDGVVVANNWEDLIDGSLYAAINVTELGTIVEDQYATAWTATHNEGYSWGSHCLNWTVISSSYHGYVGNVHWYDYHWTNNVSIDCNLLSHLYCFQQ